MSALILARLVVSIKEALQDVITIQRVVCWLDAEIALYWITRVDREYKQFLQNRVAEIRKLVEGDHWRHVPSELNPADIASRGSVPSKLKENKLWWNGPPFLASEESEWPRNERFKSDDFQVESTNESKVTPWPVSVHVVTDVKLKLEEIIRPEEYSDLHRLLKVTGYVLRFVRNCRESQERGNCASREIQEKDMVAAESIWLKHCQQSVENDCKYDLVKTSLFKDEEGILRCRGRLGQLSLLYNTKFPAILPAKHHFTRLVVRECHANVIHNGVRETLVEVSTGS